MKKVDNNTPKGTFQQLFFESFIREKRKFDRSCISLGSVMIELKKELDRMKKNPNVSDEMILNKEHQINSLSNHYSDVEQIFANLQSKLTSILEMYNIQELLIKGRVYEHTNKQVEKMIKDIFSKYK